MDKIEGINLQDLAKEASLEAVEEKKTATRNLIKQLFYRSEGLELDVRRLARELEKKKKMSEKTNEKLEKIRAGDWSVLSQENDQKEK